MRLWSLHPRYLDAQGLTACWREALLAQKVLAGLTRGYRDHPQLVRFRAAPDGAIQAYLHGIADEADARGYRFDRSRIARDADRAIRIVVSDGQLAYEWSHLRAKLAERSPRWASGFGAVATPDTHPLFTVAPGPVAAWEVGARDGGRH